MAGSCRVVALLLAVVCAQTGAEESVIAKCIVKPSSGSGAENISGQISFSQPHHGNVTITVKLSGFNTGGTQKHGFHVHKEGALGNACKDAGGHFNPHNKQHGGPSDAERHVGDLGNVVQDKDGKVDTVIHDRMVSLEGEYSVIGKAIVIHEGEDDLGKGGLPDSKTTGHAGARLGCCIIVGNSATPSLPLPTGLLVVVALGSLWRYLSLE